MNGSRRYSRDLPQGGLEIPCIYTFKTSNHDLLDKTKKRLEELESIISAIKEDIINAKVDVVCNDNEQFCDLESVGATDMDMWIKIKDITLTNLDRRLISDGEKLIDKHINSAQRILHELFPNLNGLMLSFLQRRPLNGPISNSIQILYIRGDHWVVAATGIGSKIVHVYDSVYSLLDQSSSKLITCFFHCSPCNVKITNVQKQEGNHECGLYAIANATTIAFGQDPTKATISMQPCMRDHLILCLTQKKMKLFPAI